MADYFEDALKKHKEWRGKINVVSRAKIESKEDLAVAYTPGVAAPCLEIKSDPDTAYLYTRRNNTVAVVSDGSAVLGLGNIGGLAGLPVMEGKCILFEKFGGIDAFPIVLSTQNTEEIISAVKAIAPSFGGINLEDITAPKCFEIERRLIEELDIPVFHDDQHGTAIVTLAALENALKIVKKDLSAVKICISGPGAAGSAIARLLHAAGAADIIMCDRTGTLYEGRPDMDWSKTELSTLTNKSKLKGTLRDAIAGVDVFIGVSGANIVDEKMVGSMAKNAVVFAMANPIPEIMPDVAKKAGAAVVGTGRSDFENQINNVLAFPALFRGAFDVRAKIISEKMKLAAARALSGLVGAAELSPGYILPKPFDPRIRGAVASAVSAAAVSEGLNRI